MSSPEHTTIVDKTLGIIDNLKPLKTKKSPVLAAILGFFCGGLGLGIYFQSIRDFFVPIAIWIVVALVAIPTAEGLDFLALIFCAFYGYRRATLSNAKLDELNATPQMIDATVVPSRIAAAQTALPPPLPHALKDAKQSDVEQRLEKLKELLARQIITQAEYDAKRQQILGEI